jgi:hypothetical protein
MPPRKLREDEVSFELHWEQDDTTVRGNAVASGDNAEDRACEDEIIRRLDRGDVWAWALVKVTARWGNFVGIDYLGACSYESEDEFKADAYYTDMKQRALFELNKQIADCWAWVRKLEGTSE